MDHDHEEGEEEQQPMYCLVAYAPNRVDLCVVRAADNPKELLEWIGKLFPSLQEDCDIFKDATCNEEFFPFLYNKKYYHPLGTIGIEFMLTKESFPQVKRYFPFPSNFDREIDNVRAASRVEIFTVQVFNGNISDALEIVKHHVEEPKLTFNPSICFLGAYVCNKSPFIVLKVVPSKDVQQLEDFIVSEFKKVQILKDDEDTGFGNYVPFKGRDVKIPHSSNSLASHLDEHRFQEYIFPTSKGSMNSKKIMSMIPKSYLCSTPCSQVNLFIVQCHSGIISEGIDYLDKNGMLV